MAVYKFRVTFEDYDHVSRDVEMRSVQTFEEFHRAIQDSIGFDAIKPASFFLTDNNWLKGQEITNVAPVKDNREIPLMEDSRLCDYIIDPHQRIYYMYDFVGKNLATWTFYIELIKILKESKGVVYPVCSRKAGDAPKQYGFSGVEKPVGDFEM